MQEVLCHGFLVVIICKCQEDCLVHTKSVSLQTGSAGLQLNCLLLPPTLLSDTDCHPQEDLTSSMPRGKSYKKLPYTVLK